MAQKNIHPPLHNLEIVMPDGKKMITKSTWNKGTLNTEVAFSDHPAWTGAGRGATNTASDRVKKSNERFQGINFEE